MKKIMTINEIGGASVFFAFSFAISGANAVFALCATVITAPVWSDRAQAFIDSLKDYKD